MNDHARNMRQKVKIDLIVCISQHPTARLVTNSDNMDTSISTYGELGAFCYHPRTDEIELKFD